MARRPHLSIGRIRYFLSRGTRMKPFRAVRATVVIAVLAALSSAPRAQSRPQAQTPPLTPDIPPTFTAPIAAYDYVKREVMIPMRDGVKLYTVIVMPKGAKSAPMLLTRTPYNASQRAERSQSSTILGTLPLADE